ncbi:MAG: RHS repeat-associated core domain-containing protein [Candidatus Binatia bacterium]
MIVDGTTGYDAYGHVGSTLVPYTTSYAFYNGTRTGGGGGAVLFAAPASGAPGTSMAYDAVGRVTQVTNPDASYRTVDYGTAWQTTNQDECYNAATCIGGKTIEKRDAFGRVIEKDVYEEPSTQKAGTQYTYDGLGQLKITTLWDGTSFNHNTDITITYDTLGRKIQMVDPDTGPSGSPGTWKYGYDLVGNLIYQNDPKASQLVQFCYDAINRSTKKQYFTNDSYNPGWCGSTAGTQVTYTYDTYQGSAVPYGLTRVTAVNDLSGTTLYHTYDVRGRALSVEKQISVNAHLTTATTAYQYDLADHVWKITYPDSPAETVVYGFNAEGKMVSLKNVNGSPTYLSDLWYDVFGRPTKITHGNNGTTDTRTYGNQTTNFRLASITTTQGSNTYLNLSYAAYLPTGLLRTLTDVHDSSGDLSNSATFTYDGLGRLTQASGVNLPPPNTYSYDVLGNMTLKEGTTLTYGTIAKPHRLTAVNGSQATSDDNGNRTGKPGQSYGYDPDDHLTTISAGGSVSEYYDYTGRQVARQVSSSGWTRYYSELTEEGPDNYLTKHYFAGGLRIASSRVYAPQLAGLPGEPAIMVAQAPAGHAAVVLLLRKDVQHGLVFGICVIGTGLLVAPWRRKRVVGIAIRHGNVVGIILMWTFATLPLPLLVRPAQASTPALYHYHMDHLGSTQVITDGSSGAVVEQIRYKPYGDVRYRSATTNNRYEFTGYETETTSNLEYAGARFYDPALGQFLTHDPARQFASPYTYTNWNPTNDTDPNGECDLICLMVIGFAIGFTASSIQASVNGARPLDALKAGAIGGAIGAVSAPVGAYILQPLASLAISTPLITAGMSQATAQTVADAVMLSGSLAQAGYGASQGDYTGVIGLGLNYGGAAQAGGEVNGANGAAAGQGAADATGAAGTSSLGQYAWNEVKLAGKILAADVKGFLAGVVVGTPTVIVHDVGQSLGSLAQGDFTGFASGLAQLPVDVPFPRYGWYGGRHYGLDTFPGGGPDPLNKVDIASFNHDKLTYNPNWIRDAWGGRGLAPGPFGNLYRQFGTPPFAATGVFQTRPQVLPQ